MFLKETLKGQSTKCLTTGQGRSYMREAGYVFRTQEVRHEGAMQATAGYSNQETIEKGGDCGK